jgi:hypothetical membrane protein
MMKNNSTISKIIFSGGIAGIIGPIIAMIFVFYAISIYPNFSWYSNFLSDLGVGKTAPYFNYPLIFEGVMSIIFAIGLAVALPKSAWSKVGVILLIIGSICLALAGVFNENSTDHIHEFVALLYFLLFPLSFIILGLSNFNNFKNYSTLSILAGLVALIAIFVHGQHAIPELTEALILSAWVIANGVLMVSKKGSTFVKRKIGVEEWKH